MAHLPPPKKRTRLMKSTTTSSPTNGTDTVNTNQQANNDKSKTTNDSTKQGKNKNKNKSKNKKQSKQSTTGHGFKNFNFHSDKFEKYYKSQKLLTNDKDFELFLKTLQRELPTSFRINQSSPIAMEILNKLQNDVFNLAKVEKDGLVVENVAFTKPFQLKWYPNGLGWQCTFPKRYWNKGDARKHSEIKKFRNFLIELTDSGAISRQEAVSMIPPLFLDIKHSNHIMLDMCAAPGSKTAQMIEQLHYSLDRTRIVNQPNGFVIANDSDQKRAHILVHQIKRLCSGNYVVINKLGQCIPRPRLSDSPNARKKRKERKDDKCKDREECKDDISGMVEFDRILCDVPCSSDGTMRKSPELWLRWNPQFGNGLHRIQLSILLRAIELCQIGGRIVYSTCTFNPIEDEAVIAAALMKCNQYYCNMSDDTDNSGNSNSNSNSNDNSVKNCGGTPKISVELLDVSNELPHLKRNPGLTTWKIWDKECKRNFSKWEDIPMIERRRKQYLASMFPPNEYLKYLKLSKHDEKKTNFDNSVISEMINKTDLDGETLVNKYLHLERCMRFIPYYHDTGGFFVAVLTKKSRVSFVKTNVNVNPKEAEAQAQQQANENQSDKQSGGNKNENEKNGKGKGKEKNRKQKSEMEKREAHMYRMESKEFNHRNYWSDDIPYYYLKDLTAKEIARNKAMLNSSGDNVNDNTISDNSNNTNDNTNTNGKETKKKSKYSDLEKFEVDSREDAVNFGKCELFKVAKHYGINIDLFLKNNQTPIFKRVIKQTETVFDGKNKFEYVESFRMNEFDPKYQQTMDKLYKLKDNNQKADKEDTISKNNDGGDEDEDEEVQDIDVEMSENKEKGKEKDKQQEKAKEKEKVEEDETYKFLSLNKDKRICEKWKTEILENEELLVRGLINPKSIWFVPHSVSKLICNRENDQLRIVQSGIRAFARHGNEQSLHRNHCRWRITQEGVPFMKKYLTKQICKVPLKLFLYLAYTQEIKFNEWIDKEEKLLTSNNVNNVMIKYGYYIENIKSQNGGGCVIVLDRDTCDMKNNNLNGNKIEKKEKEKEEAEEEESNIMKNRWDCLACWKSNSRIDLMIRKPDLKLTRMYLARIYENETEILLKEFSNIDLNNLKNPRYHNDPFYGMNKEERISKGVGLKSINDSVKKKEIRKKERQEKFKKKQQEKQKSKNKDKTNDKKKNTDDEDMVIVD